MVYIMQVQFLKELEFIIKKLLHEDRYSIEGAKKALMQSVFEEKEKQILVKEITHLINKLKNLS